MNTTTETKRLTDQTVKRLNDLIQVNLDSAKGFRETSEGLESASYTSLFREIADERDGQAASLRTLVQAGGDDAPDSTSFLSQAHRWWTGVRDAVTSSSNYDVLAEAERGEDKILHMYQDVEEECRGSKVHDLILEHREQVRLRHDQVRSLRDKAKALEDRD
ncbi:MAG: PA2169 family four-helix-bundle protein [Planctomycetota bacterium]